MLPLIAACGHHGVTSPPPLHNVIGATGGSLVIGQGEVSLTVPAGALTSDVLVSVAAAQPAPLAGMFAVGLAYSFAPAATTFAVPAQMVLAFDRTQVSAVVLGSEFLVAWRDHAGQVTTLLPTTVDSVSLTVPVSALGDYWVVVPDVVSAVSLFPLRNGDTYSYDGGLGLTILRTTTEPNMAALSIAKATFTDASGASGIYFDYRNSQLGFLGTFLGTERQHVFLASVLLLDRRAALGVIQPVNTSYSGYVPYGSTTVAYQGLASTVTEIIDHERTVTPLGWFWTVHVRVSTDFNDTRPARGEDVIDLWLSAGVGPVAVRFGSSATVHLLTSATVNGHVVLGGV